MANIYIPPLQDSRYIEADSEFFVVEQLDAPNYVRNGGFERGFDFWTFTGSGPSAFETGAGKFGGVAAKMNFNGTYAQTVHSPTDGTSTGYTRLYVTCDVLKTTGSGSVTISGHTGAGTLISSQSFPLTTGDWTRLAFSFVPTSATSQIRFTRTSTLEYLLDNVLGTNQVVDFHVPMPHALGLRVFDFSDQVPPFINAPGLSVRLTPLSAFGFRMSGVVGLGYEDPTHNTIALPSGQNRLLSTIPSAKDFSITGTISDASSANVDRKKAALIAALSKDLDRPVILAHKRSQCQLDIGNLGFIQCLYTGGLGLQRLDNHSQSISLDFQQSDPFVYYAPKSVFIENMDALRSPTDPTAPATFPRQRFVVRYKNQPYRSVRNTGSSTMQSQVEAGAVEDAEGHLWIWGRAADDMAFANSLTPTATTRYVVRLARGSLIPTFYAFTHASAADVQGIVLLQNGAVLAHGRFTSPAVGISKWNARTDAFGAAAGTISSSDGNFTVYHIRRIGNRMWFTVSHNVTVGGSSLGTDSQCQRAVFYTDNEFVTATRYEIEPTNIPSLQIETDNSNNLYLLSVTVPGGGDDDARVYRLTYLSSGAPYFWLTAALDEDSTHVAESYIVGSLVKREEGVGIAYNYWPAGGSSPTPYFMDIRDVGNKVQQPVPTSSFYENGGRTDKFWNSYAFTATDSTGAAGALIEYTYKQFNLTGAVEYTRTKKFLPPISRTFFKSANWEFSKEPYVNPYRTAPSQTLMTNPAAVRVSPHIRFVGGGYTTLVGRITNETNGATLAFSGKLKGGEEFVFDPENPVLPSGLVLMENTGPNGVFCLEPGVNSILAQMPTIWSPIPGGAVSGTNIVRHLELKGVYSSPYYTGKLTMVVSAGSFLLGFFALGISSLLVSGSTTPPFTEPSGTLSVLPLTGADSGGHALLYSGTYTGYSVEDIYIPVIEMTVPRASLTIEAGTI